MKIKPIREPAKDESIVYVDPELKPSAITGWRRRLNLYTGRSLSDIALSTEQTVRAGRLAAIGQMLSPGVVSGLEIGLEQDAQQGWMYRIAAGTGIAATGEDIRVHRDTRVPVHAVRVFGTRSLLLGDGGGNGDTETSGPLDARVLGDTLGDVITDQNISDNLPRAGILVMEPVTVELIGEFDPDDPCEENPEDRAFEDQQMADGCRLVHYAWPEDWMLLPVRGDQWRNRIAYRVFNGELSLGMDDVLPWEIVGVPIGLVGFDDDAAWTPLFVDRHSVVREGGRPKRRNPLSSSAGSPFLWQARFQQFAEHVAGFSPDGDMTNIPIDALRTEFRYLPPVGLLPTNALDTSQGRGNISDEFFPYAFDVEAAPAPLEQLDTVLNESASLAPFDAFASDQVRVLVPVPQTVYEPDLLNVEAVDPIFQSTINDFALERAEWLRRRDNVNGKARLISRAITGTLPDPLRPEDDDGRLEDESESLLNPAPLSPGNGAHVSELRTGLHQHYFLDASPEFTVNAGDYLITYVYFDPSNKPREIMLQWHTQSWNHRAYWGYNLIPYGTDGTTSRRYMGPLPEGEGWIRLLVPASDVGLEGQNVNGVAYTLYDGRAAWSFTGQVSPDGGGTVWFEDELPEGAAMNPVQAHNEEWIWIERDNLLAPFEENYQTAQSASGLRSVVPIDNLKDNLIQKNVSEDPSFQRWVGLLPLQDILELDNRGLVGFIDYLEDKIKRADAKIDFGYLRVHADIYRIRQFVLGTEDANRLAISPVLSQIVQAEPSAVATQEQLSSLIERLNQPQQITNSDNDDDDNQLRSNPSIVANSPTNVFTANFSSDFKVTGVDTARFESADIPITEILRRDTTSKIVDIGGVSGGTKYTPGDVTGKSPVIGRVIDRTTSIAERFESAKAVEAKNYTIATKHDVIKGLADLDISLDDIMVPGLPEGDVDDRTGLPRRGDPIPLNAFKGDGGQDNLNRIFAEPDSGLRDGAAFFNSGVDLLDHSISVITAVEGRIQAYRQAVEASRKALIILRFAEVNANRRLKIIGDELAEVRHDVAVSRALLEEETNRIDVINRRRDEIVAEHVKFLVFHRPRTVELRGDMPARALEPGFAREPVIACQREHADAPPEINDMIDLLREAPIRWFIKVRHELNRLNTMESLLEANQGSINRALRQRSVPNFFTLSRTSTGILGNSIQRIYGAQQQVMAQKRIFTSQFDIAPFLNQAWSVSRGQAEGIISPGDLMEGKHGRSDLARLIGSEINNIARVAACLYDAFGEVPPVIRLNWAERLSQFDDPVNLRNLGSLPRWNENEYLLRQDTQAMVDWLYQHVDPRETEAVSLISDLVRICILLASHAPVEQIISGNIPEPVSVQPGGIIRVITDLSRVYQGMSVVVHKSNQVVARGVVADLSATEVSAKIEYTSQSRVELDQSAKVQFTSSYLAPAAQFAFAPAQARRS